MQPHKLHVCKSKSSREVTLQETREWYRYCTRNQNVCHSALSYVALRLLRYARDRRTSPASGAEEQDRCIMSQTITPKFSYCSLVSPNYAVLALARIRSSALGSSSILAKSNTAGAVYRFQKLDLCQFS